MATIVRSMALEGIEGFPVEIEAATIRGQQQMISIIGLGDQAVKEAGKRKDIPDFSEVRGQRELLDAVIPAAAGGHNLLMIGEPGCGKSMIAARMPGILPEMTEEEAPDCRVVRRNVRHRSRSQQRNTDYVTVL